MSEHSTDIAETMLQFPVHCSIMSDEKTPTLRPGLFAAY